jgi:hypothetical protein
MAKRIAGLAAAVLAGIALPGAGIQVSTLRPRVFVRHDKAKLGKGVTVAEARGRLRQPDYARWRRPVTGRGAAAMLERAMRYLEEGNAADLGEVRDFLRSNTFSYERHDVSGFMAGAETAAAFDWIYSGLSEEDRSTILANLVTTAESSARFLRHGEPDINHNYTYMALTTVAVCGLALAGEAPPYGEKAREYLELAREFIEGPGMALDTWNAREGAWAEGSHYTFHETIRNLVLMFAAYRTASDADYFARIERRHGDFLVKTGRFLIGNTRPDLTFERLGDCTPNRVTANHTVPLTVEMLAWGLGNQSESARLRSFAAALLEAYGEHAIHPFFDWGMRVFHDPKAPRAPSYRSLPLSMRMGAGSTDQIVFRTGWDEDSAQVTIVAGDHFTDHQHFDKGHFLLYRRGGLVVDGGAYDHLYEPGGHWNEYSCRTLAHNTLLVFDPDQRFAKGYANDGGQNVLRGLQHHRDWPSYVAHRDREGLNTADVEAYDSDPARGYHYVRLNLSKAYSSKVADYDRQFVWLPGSATLIVLDRVTAERPEFAKRWLLHFQDRPRVDGRDPPDGVTAFANPSLVSVRRSGQFDAGARVFRYGGTLFVQTLLPMDHLLAVVGGPGFEFFNRFQNRNYPVSVAGRAADPREAGNWRIEVSPGQTVAFDAFLHVLQMAGAPPAEPAQSQLISDGGGKLAGALIRDRRDAAVVLFSADAAGGPIPLPVSYEVPAGYAARHLLTELPPRRRLRVEVNGRRVARVESNAQGVVVFRDRAEGKRTVRLVGE